MLSELPVTLIVEENRNRFDRLNLLYVITFQERTPCKLTAHCRKP